MDKQGYDIYEGDFLDDMIQNFEEHRLSCEYLVKLCQERTVMEVLDAIRFVEGQRND